MIPKKIHYCWFGGKPLNDMGKKCLESWKKYFPDYEIIEWNESNFDVNCCAYVKEAYKAKKWAFVADAARTYALKEYGGIYFDTDVEIFREPKDIFRDADVVLGFDTKFLLSTGVMATEANHHIFKILWDQYQTKSFVDSNEETINTKLTFIVVDFLKRKRITNGSYKIDRVKLLPREYFSCNQSNEDPIFAVHYFTGTWKMKMRLTFFQYVFFRFRCALLYRVFSRFLGNKNYINRDNRIWNYVKKKSKRNIKKGKRCYKVADTW